MASFTPGNLMMVSQRIPLRKVGVVLTWSCTDAGCTLRCGAAYIHCIRGIFSVMPMGFLRFSIDRDAMRSAEVAILTGSIYAVCNPVVPFVFRVDDGYR